MGKAREFWIDPESMDDEVGIYDTFDKHPGQGPLQWQASLIHVIEHTAYRKAVDALKRFGKHTEICIGNIGHQNYENACDCGLDETIKELGELP